MAPKVENHIDFFGANCIKTFPKHKRYTVFFDNLNFTKLYCGSESIQLQPYDPTNIAAAW
ncbi:hypothetical protein T4B_11477 [Trichinella pseudospiralis]|uniref:PiggyBac transposable element-derived protein domain-containing protein n=1 Tax=Trichinella pseudospiralis TaxID=6337 RepID=A0A0V1JAN8_TRIPS|nr:hypothetical protein T4E_4152 [Trichinella pseudospiralis]KRZ32043.1 hypothetical protein T4B_11477 [Trichinella pseudospiralis]